MKRCPQCRNTYTDDTLRFCLADGTVLEDAGEQETIERQGVRVDIEPPRTVAVSAHPHAETKKGNTAIKVVVVVLVLGFLALIVAGGVGALYFMNSGGSANVAQTTPPGTPTPAIPTSSESPTPDPEQERLEKELANALKKLEDELKSDANNSNSSPGKNSDVTDGRPTARANSPKDGFLAMREEPSTDSNLLVKIPHGATVNLENCEKQKTTISGRSGRWCMVTYQDETGWVFDAWLIYNQ